MGVNLRGFGMSGGRGSVGDVLELIIRDTAHITSGMCKMNHVTIVGGVH